MGEVSASGLVVGLQQFGYDAALCWYGILHSKHGRHSITVLTLKAPKTLLWQLSSNTIP